MACRKNKCARMHDSYDMACGARGAGTAACVTPPSSVRTHPSHGPEGLPGGQVVVAAVVDARLLKSLIRAGWGHLAEVQRRLREQQDCCCTGNPALLAHRDGLCGAAGDQAIDGNDDRHMQGGTA